MFNNLNNTAPERPLTPPDPMISSVCRICGGDIWVWETYGLDRLGASVCIDCVRDEWLSLTPWEQVSCMGYEPVCTAGARRGPVVQ